MRPARPMRSPLASSVALALVVLFGSARRLDGYSVLTHEAVVDALWVPVIQKLLLARFPAATREELRQAHAYAYGGCIIQDMGYYPFGNPFFSDLVHYVRSGDFVVALVRDAQNLNDYAFALGALAHYAGDNIGHAKAVNRSVAILYPKLAAKYGDEVTYAEDPKAHVLVEFGFDVVQVAAGIYASDDYHNFIGFQVSKPLLDRAFKETYGLDIRDVLFNEDLTLGTYRYAASKAIPQFTRAAWQYKRRQIEQVVPGVTQKRFVYQLSRQEYEQEYGKHYRRAGLRDRLSVKKYGKGIVTAARTPGSAAKLLAIVFAILPKFGLLHALNFKPATPETEHLFLESLAATRAEYRQLLNEVAANRLDLPNQDFDTGQATRPGEYPLADRAYANLLARLEKKHFKNVTPELRANILSFYDAFDPTQAPKKCKVCKRIPLELQELKAPPVPIVSAGAASP